MLKVKRSKLLLGLIPILVLIVYVLVSNGNIFADQTYEPIDPYQTISDTLAKPKDGSAPTDYSAKDNFAIAAGMLLDTGMTPFYQATTTGTVVADIMNYKQEVSNTKVVKNGAVFAESISLSAFASVAEQKYFSGNTILYRKGATKGSSVSSWPNEVREMSEEYFSANYGVIPREITKLSVTDKSFKSGSGVTIGEDGTYTYTLELNPGEAQYYSKREIMTHAGVTKEPTFYSCKLTFTIDENWRVLKIVTEDHYKIDMMLGTECRSTLTEVFSYEGDMPERAQIFIDYKPTGDTNDGNKEPSFIDYLNMAFGDYISGAKPLGLSATVTSLGKTVNVTAKIDLKENDFRIKMDNLFVAYVQDTLYIDNSLHKGKITTSDISQLTKALGLDLGSIGGILDDPDLLEKLFANTELQITDTHVTIPIAFDISNISISANIVLLKQGDSAVLESINGKILIKKIYNNVTLPFYIDAVLDDNVVLPEIKADEYHSYGNITQALSNTVQAKTFDFDASIAVNGLLPKPLNIRGQLVLGNPITAKATLTYDGISANLTFDGEYIYFAVKNIKLKVEPSRLNEVIGIFAEAASVTLPTVDVDKLLSSLPQSFIPSPINFSNIFNILYSVDYDGNTLKVGYNTMVGRIDASITANERHITAVSLSGIQLNNYTVAASVSLLNVTSSTTPITVQDASSYIDVVHFTKLIPVVQNLIKAQSYTLEITQSSFSSSVIEGELNGVAHINRDGSFYGTFNYKNLLIEVAHSNNTIYVGINNIKFKLRTDELGTLNQILLELFPSMPNMEEIGTAISTIVQNMRLDESLIPLVYGGLDMIDSFTFDEQTGRYQVVLVHKGFSATLQLGIAQDGSLLFDVTHLFVQNAFEGSLSSRLTAINEVTTVAFDDSAYISVIDLLQFARITQNEFYSASLTGNGNINGQNIEFDVKIKVQQIENKLPSVYLNLYLFEKAKHKVELTFMDNRTIDESGNPIGDLDAFATYNGLKVTIDYTHALQIIGITKDIVGLKIPQLDAFLQDKYTPVNAEIFSYLPLGSLQVTVDRINQMFADGNRPTLPTLPSFGKNEMLVVEDLLSKLSLSLIDGVLSAELADFKGINTTFSLSNAPFEPITAPTEHFDANTLPLLLQSVVNTANMKEFEMNGTATLNAVINANVGINAKVKILEDGSTVAAIKLSVPRVAVLVELMSKSDSYIYFYNNRLYFVVDLYSYSWGNTKYKTTEIKSCSVEEFMANPFDYIFFAIRLSNTVKNPIMDAINKEKPPITSEDPYYTDASTILKNYTMTENRFDLSIGLKELTKNTDLGDANISITTQNNYITRFKFDTQFVDFVKLGLGDGATLSNLAFDENGNALISKVGKVEYGQKYNKDKLGTIDNLKEDLAAIFGTL